MVIKGNPGTFQFQYTGETGTEVSNAGDGFEFKGTLYDTYIEKENNTKYHVLSMVNGNIGMYQAKINKNSNGEAGDTHFLNNANKVYLKIALGSTISMSSFIRFSFEDKFVTDIEDIKDFENGISVIHDLQGRRITEITKPGLYIINNKKVFVK